jgi:restriction endonuclease S subunit
MTSKWHEVPLRELVGYISKGIAPSYAENETETTIRVLNQKCNRNFQISYAESRLHETVKKKVPADRYVKEHDILINSTGAGTAGRIAQIGYVPQDTTVDGHMIILRANDKVTQRYLGYALKAHQWEVLQLDEGSTGQTELNRERLLDEIMICYPESFSEQEEIVLLLEGIDHKMLVNTQINDNLEQQTQTIYRERFEGVSPDNLPFDWRIVTLGEVATISNKSFNPLKEAERLLEHYSIPAFDEARFPVFEPSTSIKSNKFIIDASCFMISKLNPTTKRVWKPYCITENAVCSTEFIVYKAKDQAITDFLYSVIDSSSFTDFMCSHVTGSTGSRQRTTPSDTLTYELVLPSDDELAEFQSVVSPMYAQMRINAIENDRLKRLRDSLLPKLMSGEIDVSGIQL